MSHRALVLFSVLSLWLVIAIACGARSELDLDPPPSSGGGNVPTGAGGNAGGFGGVAGAGGSGGFFIPTGGGPTCVTFESEAAVAPLDLFIMLDSSGSMDFQIQGNTTKWQAVRNAFSAFASDGDSAGIGIALAFFPIIDFSEPAICNAVNPLCGTPNHCVDINVCPTAFVTCDTDQDCADAGYPQDDCVPYGVCQNAPGFPCLPTEPSFNCQPNTGPCIQAGSCWDHYTCESQPYQNPVFGVSKLPGAASGFINTIDSKSPNGGTPTLPALVGSIDAAIAYKNAQPSHTVITLLTTDGLPTLCDDDMLGNDPNQPIQNLADVAAAGLSQGVETWVIGVFAPDEQLEAQQNLDQIAMAGGTTSAFIVDTSQTTTQQFIDALNEVRQNALSCEFELLPSSEPIDYTDVWIRVVDNDNNQVWIPRVADETACAGGHGFHYDVPVPANTPNRIILCPATCDLTTANPEQSIEVFSTCDDPRP